MSSGDKRIRDTIRVYYLYISIATISNKRGKENKKNIPVLSGSGAWHIVHARTCHTASGYSNIFYLVFEIFLSMLNAMSICVYLRLVII